jgi:hypothetical protein
VQFAVSASTSLVLVALAFAAGAACSSSKSNPAEEPPASDASAIDTSSPVVVTDAGVDAEPAFDASLPSPLLQISQTGLYDDIASKRMAANLIGFTPGNVLWSDGATKRRFIVLPPGKTIDTSDMNHWRFPVGTRFFKEFSRDGKLLETRLIYRRAETGDPEKDYWAGAFAWRDDESDADFVIDGKQDVRGTDHDIPAQTRCFSCHLGEPGRILGFSALQLAKPGPGVSLADLAASGRLSAPPPAGADYSAPGDATTSTGIGYLHANCGHCHNPNGIAWPDTQMILRLDVSERDPAATLLEKSTVGIALQRWMKPGYSVRIDPGKPATSAILARMKARGDSDQMPPIATEHADQNGIDLVTAWIQSL